MAESSPTDANPPETDPPEADPPEEVTVSEADRTLVDALTTYTRSDSLTFQEQRFVMFCMKGLQPVAAARAAGYTAELAGPSLLRQKRIRQAMQNVTQYELYDTRVTRERLTHMLFEAHSHAATATEEINAIRELGKMHGTYEATKVEHKVDLEAKITNVRQLEQLSDAELAQLAGDKPLFSPEDAIDGEYVSSEEPGD